MDTAAADVDKLLDPVLVFIDAANRTASAAVRLVAAAQPGAREESRSLLLALDQLQAAQDRVLAPVAAVDGPGE
jgi:hypothetical protein